jgi:hypothetical protein
MEELAILRNPEVGRTDNVAGPTLRFGVAALNWGADIVLSGDRFNELAGSVEKVSSLHGKPCVVERRDGIVTFLRMFGQ